MGFLKELGSAVGSIAGVVIGTPIILAGEVVNSDFIKEVGEGACKATANTGKVLGSLAEGTVECVSGLVSSDSAKASRGFEQVVDTGVKTVAGVGLGVLNLADKGINTIGAIAEGDKDKAVKIGKELVKTACVATLAVGVFDAVDGAIDDEFDLFDHDDSDSYQLVENPDTHHVEPHERELSDGSVIWVDGDGDTTVDTHDGWEQHNPDYRI
jgi:hypothetical protein